MRRRGLILAGALIIVTNAFVLFGVARNRSGQPRQTIQLTERELTMGPRGNEDTGVSLRLQWNQYSLGIGDELEWLDRAKLESLGFDCAVALRDHSYRPLMRPAFLVFEYNGPAWEAWQKRQEERNANKAIPLASTSRLIPIDAAPTPEPLLRKYTGSEKYMIVRGVVRLFVNNWDPKTQKPGPYRLQPSISELLPGSIHVPLPLSSLLDNRSSRTAAASFHYPVTLAYGSRFEPWVVKVE